MGGRKRRVHTKEKKQAEPRNTNKGPMWTVESDKVVRTHRSCPKCGPAVFLADHYDRMHCGQCGYTIFKHQQPNAGEEERTERISARKRKEE
jgi:ubiquitin-small subunit ribosomal protein S27Ae